jgi:hypothetical protein
MCGPAVGGSLPSTLLAQLINDQFLKKKKNGPDVVHANSLPQINHALIYVAHRYSITTATNTMQPFRKDRSTIYKGQ